jgi:hypothetical protein
MNDVKDIFIFLSFSYKRFLMSFFYYSIYFFAVIILTLLIFFINYRYSNNNMFFIVFLFVLIIGDYFLERYLFLKNKYDLNMAFFNYLNKKKDFSDIVVNKDWRIELKKTKQELKDQNIKIYSRKILCAISVIKRENNALSFKEIKNSMGLIWKYFFYELFIFIVILLPFAIISFIFSFGFVIKGPVNFLIFTLGFIFVYFLEASLIKPIFYLIIQKKLYERIYSSS